MNQLVTYLLAVKAMKPTMMSKQTQAAQWQVPLIDLQATMVAGCTLTLPAYDGSSSWDETHTLHWLQLSCACPGIAPPPCWIFFSRERQLTKSSCSAAGSGETHHWKIWQAFTHTRLNLRVTSSGATAEDLLEARSPWQLLQSPCLMSASMAIAQWQYMWWEIIENTDMWTNGRIQYKIALYVKYTLWKVSHG